MATQRKIDLIAKIDELIEASRADLAADTIKLVDIKRPTVRKSRMPWASIPKCRWLLLRHSVTERRQSAVCG